MSLCELSLGNLEKIRWQEDLIEQRITLKLIFVAALLNSLLVLLCAITLNTFIIAAIQPVNYLVSMWPFYFFSHLFCGYFVASKISNPSTIFSHFGTTKLLYDRFEVTLLIGLGVFNAILLIEPWYQLQVVLDNANAIKKLTFLSVMIMVCVSDRILRAFIIIFPIVSVTYFVTGAKSDWLLIAAIFAFRFLLHRPERFLQNLWFFTCASLLFFVVVAINDKSFELRIILVRLTGNFIHFLSHVDFFDAKANVCSNISALFPFIDKGEAFSYYESTIRPLSSGYSGRIWWDSVSLYERLIHVGCGSLIPAIISGTLFFFLGFTAKRLNSNFPLLLGFFILLTSWDGMFFYDVVSFGIFLTICLVGFSLFTFDLYQLWKTQHAHYTR